MPCLLNLCVLAVFGWAFGWAFGWSVKVRLTKALSNDGKNEPEGFARAISAAEASNSCMMIHHSD
eukprot:SAG31_NODE_35375_length_323_cov_1.754464_1_plen_64_part_01